MANDVFDNMRPGEVVFFTGPTPPLIRHATPLCLDFPMRPDFLAQIVVPRHMTLAEAKRLCAFIETLVTPDSAEAPR